MKVLEFLGYKLVDKPIKIYNEFDEFIADGTLFSFLRANKDCTSLSEMEGLVQASIDEDDHVVPYGQTSAYIKFKWEEGEKQMFNVRMSYPGVMSGNELASSKEEAQDKFFKRWEKEFASINLTITKDEINFDS